MLVNSAFILYDETFFPPFQDVVIDDLPPTSPSGNDDDLSKRRRSEDTPKGKNKRPKLEFRIVVADVNPMNANCIDAVFRGLAAQQDAVPLGEQQPTFTGHGVLDGEIWFEATDSYSLEWLKVAVDQLRNLPMGCAPECKNYIPPPKLIWFTGVIPICGVNRPLHSTVIKHIDSLNPGLVTKYWKIFAINTNRSDGRHQLVLGIDEGSLPKLEKNEYRVFYRFSRVKLRRSDKRENHAN